MYNTVIYLGTLDIYAKNIKQMTGILFPSEICNRW